MPPCLPSPLLLALLLLLLHSAPSALPADLSSDSSALLSFKNLTSLPHLLASWNSSSLVCSSWEGVQCSGNGSSARVSSLRLPGKSLFGAIPSGTLGNLDALDTLSLRSNKLSGSLPADLANCASLRKLNLENNQFSGPLPSNFSAWPLLSQLNLSVNNFSGPIPPSIGTLSHLKTLNLQRNSLSGAIPPINISSLTDFNVSDNQLNGSIPSTLSRFPAESFSGNSLCGFPFSNCSSQGHHHHKLSTGAILGIVFGSLALLFIVLLLCVCFLCRQAEGEGQGRKDLFAGGRSQFERGSSPAALDGGRRDPASTAAAVKEQDERSKFVFIDSSKNTFDLEELLRASAEVLGKGSLGTSYKAVLEVGMVVAVKRLRDVVRGDYHQYLDKLGGSTHENVVPLRAYYFAKEEKLLVYDYMSNGSLSALLHGGHSPLDWDTRVRIALGAAQGIAYLHSRQVVHGNIKSSNILLTRTLDGCVADYGLVQLVMLTPGSNKVIGYTAPEVTDPRRVTPKADVYSFGVLLLELLTGRAPTQASTNGDSVGLPKWVQSVVQEEWTAEVFDTDLMKYQNIEEEMVQLLQVAMPCVTPSPSQRPSMADVVKMIENLRKTDEEQASEFIDHYPGSTTEID